MTSDVSAVAVNGVVTVVLDAALFGTGAMALLAKAAAGLSEDALRVKLPPSAASPTDWVDASTGAPPVKLEKLSMNCWPAAPSATSQP